MNIITGDNVFEVLMTAITGICLWVANRIRKQQEDLEKVREKEKEKMELRVKELEDSLPKMATEIAVLSATLTSVIQTSVKDAMKPMDDRLRNIEVNVAKLQAAQEAKDK